MNRSVTSLFPTATLRSRAAKTLLVLGLAAGPMLFGGAAATILVVKSLGPSSASYKPGKALPDNAKVALRQSDVLVVLASDSKRTLVGPGTFDLASANAARSAPSALRRGRFSALRTAGIVPRSPTLWHVDVSQSGKVCLVDSSNVMLWRPEATDSVEMKIARAGGAAQAVEWPAGQATLAWPEALPIAPNTDYEVTWQGKTEATHLTFTTLATTPTDIKSVAEALISQKCENQLNVLIETVPAEG
jgi:hypothetical protein